MKTEKRKEVLNRKLSPEQYHVLVERGTEKPFSGKLLYNKRAGNYSCARCGNVIFDSSTKFDADCGWPSFYSARAGSVRFKKDFRNLMIRKEVVCAKCGAHLGHLFKDAPQTPTGNRYCINSVALDFKPKKNLEKKIQKSKIKKDSKKLLKKSDSRKEAKNGKEKTKRKK